MSCYAFRERLKFVILKIGKTVSKKLSQEEHGESNNKEFQVSERVILLPL